METYESVKSNPVQPEQKEKKKGGAWKGIVAVILAAGVVGSTTISAFNLVTLKSYIAEQKKLLYFKAMDIIISKELIRHRRKDLFPF